MKLRNKLIPLMTLATATTAVAPIVTSCSSNSLPAGTMDVTSPYTPTIARAEKLPDSITDDKVIDIYMDHVMNNPEILAQDIWCYESRRLPSIISYLEFLSINIDGDISESPTQVSTITDVVANVTATNIQVKRIDAILEGKKTQFYTIDMDLGYEFNYKMTSLSTEPRIEAVQSTKFNSTYKNVPLFIYAQDDYWWFSIDVLDESIDKLASFTDPWSVKYDMTASQTLDIITHGLKQTFVQSGSDSDTFTRRSQITSKKPYSDFADTYLNYPSYHIGKVSQSSDTNVVEFNTLGTTPPYNFIDAPATKGTGGTFHFVDGQKVNPFKELSNQIVTLNNQYHPMFRAYTTDPTTGVAAEAASTIAIKSDSDNAEGQIGTSNGELLKSDGNLYFDYLYITPTEDFGSTKNEYETWCQIEWVDDAGTIIQKSALMKLDAPEVASGNLIGFNIHE